MTAFQSKPFIRKSLDHGVHFAGRFGATYFVTVCCDERLRNQLCHIDVSRTIFETATIYDEQGIWCLKLLVLMPDHLHGLVSVDGDAPLGRIIGNFKRAISRFAGVKWQRNFFDHRLRRDESLAEKAAYIRQNPVRAGLTKDENLWPYVLDRIAIEDGGSVNRPYLK